ncbi:iron uptake porin [Calothrix sp. UHCC 0171]|uniref:iron uptake porin n=1 Tax=Calothrix sp. UHCC 0171 TaxID=3110245 RepID=UPI002B1FF25B|nr:iron uptake porin [Calothrix sp. UHCC 0171]MEA5572863.1 iron uptake porin [Calothrix sp. UHCC 0171]
MSDIGLLMAGILTTGQATLSELPEEPAIQPDSVQESDKEEKAGKTEFSSQSTLQNTIAPPELTLSENSSQPTISELTQKQKKLLNKITEKAKRDEEIQELSPSPRLPLTASPNHRVSQSPSLPITESPPHRISQSPTPEFIDSISLDSKSPDSTFPDSTSTDGMSQVTSVSQLGDIDSSHWAFSAAQSLVERYGCVAGYPDGTFKGNRSMSRHEFAAGLNACLDKINELIATNQENLAKQEDLIELQRLQAEFQPELTILQARLNNLEERTAELEANQFSTTTKLYGQAIFSVQGTNEGDIFLYRGEETPRKAETNVTFTSSSQLTLATSFNGRDLLLTGLAAGNLGSSTQAVSTNMGRLGFESDTGNNDVYLNELSYRFPVSDNFGVVVGTAGVNPINTFRGINPLEGSGDGAISLFGQRNPILAIGSSTSGVGFDWQISDRISLQGIYSAQIASFPGDINVGGLFGGNYTAGAQITVAPTDNVDIGVHYLFNHSPDGNLRTGIGDTQLVSPFAPQTTFDTHAVGATVAWRVNPNLQLGGWGGWTASNPVNLSGTVETTNWAVFAAFPNLFRPGNLGGLIVGQPPKITSSTLPDGYNLPNFALPDFETGGGKGGREDTSLHLELFYRAQINDNISLTPGLFVILNPNHNNDNDTLVVGAMRATFRF